MVWWLFLWKFHIPYFFAIILSSKHLEVTFILSFFFFFKYFWIPMPRWGLRNSTPADGFWKITNSPCTNLLNSNKRTSPKSQLATDDLNSKSNGPLAQLKATLIVSDICYQWEEDLHFSPIIIIVIKDNRNCRHSNLNFLCTFPCGVPSSIAY